MEKPVTEHVYSVLSKSEIGSQSSVGQHLNHLFKLNQLGDHQYITKSDSEENLLGIDKNIKSKIQAYINDECTDKIDNVTEAENTDIVTADKIILQDELPVIILQSQNVYNKSCKYYKETLEDINNQVANCPIDHPLCIKLDLSFLEVPTPSGTNYVDAAQNSDEWHNTRNKKITGSRLGSLIGLHGNKKFDDAWDIVKTGRKENDISGIENMKRGLMFKEDGIKYFEKESKSITKTCGFFFHPSNHNYVELCFQNISK